MMQLELNQIQGIHSREVQGSGSSPPEAASSSLKKNCVDCKEDFEIEPGEDWKTRCFECYIKRKNGDTITGTEKIEPERKQEVVMPSVKHEETPTEKMLSTGLTGVFVVHTHMGKVELKPEDLNEIEVGGFGTRDGRLDTKDYSRNSHHVYSVPNYELEELQTWLNEHKKVNETDENV